MHTEQDLIEESQVVNQMHELIIRLFYRHQELFELHQAKATAFINQAVVDDQAILSPDGLHTRRQPTEMTLAEEVEELVEMREHFTMLTQRHMELSQQLRANREAFELANQQWSPESPAPLSSPSEPPLVIDETTPPLQPPTQEARRRLVFDIASDSAQMVEHIKVEPEEAPTTAVEHQRATPTPPQDPRRRRAIDEASPFELLTKRARLNDDDSTQPPPPPTQSLNDIDSTQPPPPPTQSLKDIDSTQAQPPQQPPTQPQQAATAKKARRGRVFKQSKREYFVVQTIVGQRLDNCGLSFKLRWKNRGPESDSWVRAADCRCEHLISLWKQEFHRLAYSEEQNYFFEFYV